MNLEVQGLTLLYMLLAGGMLGIVFDSYRIISGHLHFPRWSIHGFDLVYWVGAALFVFRMLYHSNQGELRFYVFLGLFLGVWIYFLFLSVITERFVVMLMKIVNRIYAALVRIFQIFIVGPLRLAWKAVRLLLGFSGVILMFLLRTFGLPVWRLIVWATSPLVRRLRIPDGLHWLKRKGSAFYHWLFKK